MNRTSWRRPKTKTVKPYIMVGHKSDKGFNTTVVTPKAKAGAGCLGMGMFKPSVDGRRIRAEVMRRKLAAARFIPAARLVHDGKILKRVRVAA